MVDYCGCLEDDDDEDGLIADAHLWRRSSRCDNIREMSLSVKSECFSTANAFLDINSAACLLKAL